MSSLSGVVANVAPNHSPLLVFLRKITLGCGALGLGLEQTCARDCLSSRLASPHNTIHMHPDSWFLNNLVPPCLGGCSLGGVCSLHSGKLGIDGLGSNGLRSRRLRVLHNTTLGDDSHLLLERGELLLLLTLDLDHLSFDRRLFAELLRDLLDLEGFDLLFDLLFPLAVGLLDPRKPVYLFFVDLLLLLPDCLKFPLLRVLHHELLVVLALPHLLEIILGRRDCTLVVCGHGSISRDLHSRQRLHCSSLGGDLNTFHSHLHGRLRVQGVLHRQRMRGGLIGILVLLFLCSLLPNLLLHFLHRQLLVYHSAERLERHVRSRQPRGQTVLLEVGICLARWLLLPELHGGRRGRWRGDSNELCLRSACTHARSSKARDCCDRKDGDHCGTALLTRCTVHC
mmetsp:Transcript_102258/g.164837  ORF Transcript_102258/g.164837 Transcript_102258/m.164837 type:complete len:397 (+) Transcript_102258:344-1534(+)